MTETNTVEKKITYKTYFSYSNDESLGRIGTCLLCQAKNIEKKIKMKQGNTSGLKQHLKLYHQYEYKILFGTTTSTKHKVSNQQTLEVFVSILSPTHTHNQFFYTILSSCNKYYFFRKN